ncbi:uncharacterized protein LOC107051833 [Gallus gallus]|uniref:uncharacterized protein LOC107051833 n=1 Tax=Gallus gallus TaxID=9031 RepID=UPI001F00E0C1|nr:uncharacterized protein LOC107051833 [Gallus gallus]
MVTRRVILGIFGDSWDIQGIGSLCTHPLREIQMLDWLSPTSDRICTRNTEVELVSDRLWQYRGEQHHRAESDQEEYNSPNSHVTCITTPNTSKCYKYLTVGTHFHLFSQQKLMQLQIHQSHQQPNLTKHTAMAVTTVTPPPLHRVVQLLSPTQPRPCSSPALWDTAAMEMWSHRSENVTTKCKQSIQLQQESWHCLR